MDPIITSTTNPRIKNLISLSKPSVRKETGLFVIEGIRELGKAGFAGYEFNEIFICPDVYKPLPESFQKKNKEKITYISKKVFDAVVYREDCGGIIATAYVKEHSLELITLSENPLVLVIENVEKPGNIGGILRTTEAAAVDAVIICNHQTDLYNPNVIRSSLGTIFTNNIALCSTSEAIKWLKSNQIRIFSSTPSATSYYYDFDFTKASAIVLGSEAEGMSNPWFKESDYLVKIPMPGKVDSLNVSVSGAIFIYEALRQRLTIPGIH